MYKEIKELLKMVDVNPYELYILDKKSYTGWFPDLPERSPTVNVRQLSNIILGKEG